MDSMAKNQVWELVDLPLGRKPIGNKWVLKIKCKVDGSIDKYKARLWQKANILLIVKKNIKFGNYYFSFKQTFSNLIFSAYNPKHRKT